MFKYIVTSSFGLEKITKHELTKLGYEILSVENGSIEVEGGLAAIADLNINLRTADRVFLKLAEFEARSFDELFECVYRIPWEEYLSEGARFPVLSKSVKSKLYSKSDIQSVSKKAIVKKLSEDYGIDVFCEKDETVEVHINILNDCVSVLLNSSGAPLHKRGYRIKQGPAPLKETLAAGILMLSDWKLSKVLVDPFCGSGTIGIEAAMMGMNIAPGINRHFASEDWIFLPENLFKKAKVLAKQNIRNDIKADIRCFDIDGETIRMARENAEEAGVIDNISFKQMAVKDLKLPKEKGVIVCNPPYGERLSDREKVLDLYEELGDAFFDSRSFSAYILTANPDFENAFGDRADKNRKLYNGNIKCYLYQYRFRRVGETGL